MLSLYFHLFDSLIRCPISFFLAACLCVIGLPAFATSCNSSPIFAFSQALYVEQYEAAVAWLPEIERERGVEMARFLGQVLAFKRGFDEDNVLQQQIALDEIDAVIALAAKQAKQSGDSRRVLVVANMMIHAARMQLAAEHVLRAVNLAREGKRLLDKALIETPGNANALLANGLYYYYTDSEKDALSWVMDLWSLNGDKARGREMMEKAVGRSADHAFEAARSLLSDVAWNRQDTCRYLALFEGMDKVETETIAPLQTSIAARLFCGHIQLALKQIESIDGSHEHESYTISTEQRDWLFAARVYALAEQGEVKQLNRLLDSLVTDVRLRYRQVQFSLAKALDIRGARENAERLYRKILAYNIDDIYQTLAGAYLENPYRKSKPFNIRTKNSLQFACGSGSSN